MADNEKSKLYYAPRRATQQNRPTPGVQKAIQTFGVRDLREILNKKREEQGESPDDKRPNTKSVNLPPPDPSYNYLKDPTRDRPVPQRKPDHERQYERPIPRDRGTNSQQHRYRDVKTHRERDQETVQPEEKLYDVRENKHQERGVLKKNQNLLQAEGVPRKELRFLNTPVVVEEQGQFTRGGRRSFRGRNARRGRGGAREEKIENPFNIKIQLSTETGLRNCTLDESTKIADIKHVPDNQRHSRGSFRGTRGGLRGRGRGSYGGRGAFSYKGKDSEFKIEYHDRDRFNLLKLKESLPDETEKDRVQPVENGNLRSDTSAFKENNKGGDNQQEETSEDFEENLEHYEEYEPDNDEYNDANENYDDEFSNEYFSEYHNDSAELTQILDNSGNYENSPESETYDHSGLEIIDPNLKGTITITSSKVQNGEVKRSIEVTQKNNEAEIE